jgi:hypothetical protein
MPLPIPIIGARARNQARHSGEFSPADLDPAFWLSAMGPAGYMLKSGDNAILEMGPASGGQVVIGGDTGGGAEIPAHGDVVRVYDTSKGYDGEYECSDPTSIEFTASPAAANASVDTEGFYAFGLPTDADSIGYMASLVGSTRATCSNGGSKPVLDLIGGEIDISVVKELGQGLDFSPSLSMGSDYWTVLALCTPAESRTLDLMFGLDVGYIRMSPSGGGLTLLSDAESVVFGGFDRAELTLVCIRVVPGAGAAQVFASWTGQEEISEEAVGTFFSPAFHRVGGEGTDGDPSVTDLLLWQGPTAASVPTPAQIAELSAWFLANRGVGL